VERGAIQGVVLGRVWQGLAPRDTLRFASIETVVVLGCFATLEIPEYQTHSPALFGFL
jgi:hypothetical protein